MKKTLVLLVVLTLIFSGISTILSNIAIAATTPLVIEFTNGTVNDEGIVTAKVDNETYEMKIGSGTEGSVPLEVDGNQLRVRNNKELEVNVENIRDYYIYLSSGDDQKVKTIINGQEVEFSQGKIYLQSGTDGAPMSVELKAKTESTSNPIIPEGTNPPVTEGQEFSGTVFFAWNNNNNVCVAEINDIKPGGRAGYPMNYIKESEVKDFIENDQKVLDISKTGNDYYWLWESSYLIIQDEGIMKSWDSFKEYMEKEENKRKYAIDPCGSINGNNTITTNGDREFRATIYSDNKYEAISFGTNVSDYTYFPGFWDQVFYSSTVDISGTTKTNPAKYEAYLLEKTIKFKTGENSKYNITSVKALVDNKDAVKIKNNNGVFEITFNSNYYDKVILELTDVQGNNYYVKICRTVMQVHDNFGPGITEAPITAKIYYPEAYSYNDFEVYATINYKDGSSKTELAKNTDLIDNGSNLGKEGNGGNGLKRSAFKVNIDSSNITDVSFNVIYKNTNKDTYKGTFAGSGKGVTYNIEEREIVYE